MEQVLSRKGRMSRNEDGSWLILIPERRVMMSNRLGFWDACVTDELSNPERFPEAYIETLEEALSWALQQPEVHSSVSKTSSVR